MADHDSITYIDESDGGERCPLDGEAVKESQESDEEHEVTESLLPKQPGAAASQGNSTVRERNAGEGSDGVDVQPGSAHQPRGADAGSVAREQDGTTKTHINVEALVHRREEDHQCSTEQHISGAGSQEAVLEGGKREQEHLETNQTLQGVPGQSAGGARSQGSLHVRRRDPEDGRDGGEELTDRPHQPRGTDAGGEGRGQTGFWGCLQRRSGCCKVRRSVDREADKESQESAEDSEDKDSWISFSEYKGGSVTGWNASELFEDIKRKLDKLEASIPGGAIAKITDIKINDKILKWARQAGGNHDLSIDCILGEKIMIQQLAKFHQSNSVGALLDVILAEGDSEKKEKDDKWADLFKQLGGLMLLELFRFTDRLEKIITSQFCNPSKLVKVFVHAIKEASETTSKPRWLNFDNLVSTIDGSIAAIISQMKPNAPTLLRNLKDILNDLDATLSKWKDDQEEEHADVEESEKKEETEIDSLKNQDLSIDCIIGQKIMVKLAKFKLLKSIKALLDVILAEGGSEKKEKDDEWADLFKQLGGLMLYEVFRFTDRLEKIITSQCCNPSKLVKVFVHVIKEASETRSEPRQFTRNMEPTIDGGIAAIISQKKPNAPTLLRNLKDILNDLDATFSKWKDDQEEEHADVEESEKKEEDKERENDSLKKQDLSIDCIIGETFMIKQLAKFELTKSVKALLDVILAEGGSEKKEKDDEWANFFKKLGGKMLLNVFINTDRLEKITTRQCNNPSELVKVFIQVMKQASETTSREPFMSRGGLGTTIDGSIGAIIFLMKTNASWLLRYLKDILKDLDAIFSKWTDEQEKEHADVEDDKETEKYSLKTESLNITCFRGEHKDIITKLVEFSLTKSVRALLDVLLSAKDDNKVEDDEWVDLFKQLGPNMLRKVFDEDSGQLFIKIIKSKRWRKNATLTRIIFDAMQRKTATRILSASVNKDDKHCSKTVFTKLATSCNSLCSHDLFQQYTNAKWKQYGPYCILVFVLYLCMTFSLIYTLVTSVMAVNVHIYESGLDHSRLVFEVIAAISVIGCLLIELFLIKRSRLDYFTDWNNWLKLLSSLLLCISIPLRFTAEHVHWYLFAFGYFLWIFQWNKQCIVFKYFYIQAEFFVQVLKHEVPWFTLLFLVINTAFAGASYLTLKGEKNLHVDNQTSSFSEIFFMGVRTSAEGQPVLEYYGNEEYRAMSIVVLVVFLFAMCVILLNLLIAQIGKTLDIRVLEIHNNYHKQLAFTLAWMDILLPECCNRLGKTEKRFKKYIDRPELYKEKIISNTDKMGQHLAKITGDLQDISQTFSISIKEDDVQKTGRQQTVGGDVLHTGHRKNGRESERREQWNKIYKYNKHHEGKVLDFIEICIQEGHNPAEWMVDGQCPLYIAVEQDHVQVLRRLLDLLDPISTEANERKAEALCTAVRCTNRFHQAALLVNNLKTSEPQRVFDCFDNGVSLDDACNYANPDFWLALMDVMWNLKNLSLFEKNVQGEWAKGTEPTIFHRLADRGNTSLFKHAAFRLYTEKKWMECGRKKQVICDLLIYLLTLVCLTVVVVLSGQAKNVNIYQTNTDRTRLGFEIVSASLIMYALVKEVLELISTCRLESKYAYVGKKRRHIESRWWFISKLQKYDVWRGIRAYWKDHFNKAECTSTLLLLPVNIIARVLDSNAFWYIFAFGYFVWVMIFFKYSSIHRELSTYAQSLWMIITTDVFYFFVLFSVVNMAFSGFFVLVLKGENSMHVHNETSTFWGTLFFGVRALTDGQNSLNYYDADGGPDGYNTFLTVATMVVILFVVIVILANIFIAQMSWVYTHFQENAQLAAWERKLRDIARLERFEWPYCFGTLKSKKLDHNSIDLKDFKRYDNIKRTATFEIENVDRLVNKLAELESDVVGIKAKATRCKNEWSTERHDLKTNIQTLKEENEKMKIQLNASTEENKIAYHS